MSKKGAFITFSSKAYSADESFYNELVDHVKNNCGYNLTFEWFKSVDKITTPDEVHRKSLTAINESDVVIAETSNSSTGMGQQISYAIQKKKDVLLLLNDDLKEDNKFAFVRGNKSTYVHFIYYKNLVDLKNQLCTRLSSLKPVKLEKFNFISTARAKRILSEESNKRGISQSELLREIVDEWIGKNKLNI